MRPLAEEMRRVDDVLRRYDAEPGGTGASETDIVDLGAALSPFGIPADVVAFLRWPPATVLPLFSGRPGRSVATILEWRAFEVDTLHRSPAWLILSDVGNGPYYFATLDIPGCDPLPDIWEGDTHDVGLVRVYLDLAGVVGTFGDLLEAAGSAAPVSEEFWSAERWPGQVERLQRNPGTWSSTDAPVGSAADSFLAPDWPEPWVRSVGITSAELAPRGATTTIVELKAMSGWSRARGTVRGRVTRLAATGETFWMVVTDDTGEIAVRGQTHTTRYSPRVSTELEADLQWDGAEFIATALRPLDPEPGGGAA